VGTSTIANGCGSIGLPLDRRQAASRVARSAPIVAEIVITFTLLGGASVLLRSFDRLAHVDLGLTSDHVLTMTVTLDDTSYPTPTVRAGYFQRVLDRVQALPGVTTAAIANYTPITRPGFNVRFAIEGRSPAEPGDVTTAPLATVSPSFLAALRIPLLRGRLFRG
jgi:putative ABC transport system permease protein